MNTLSKFVIALVLIAAAVTASAQDFEAIGRGLVNQLVGPSVRQGRGAIRRSDEGRASRLPSCLKSGTRSCRKSVRSRASRPPRLERSKVCMPPSSPASSSARRSMPRSLWTRRARVKGLFFEPASSSGGGPPGAAEWKAPPYSKPDNFHERDTIIVSGRWNLPGVLTLPNAKFRCPAVVLVQGSGPQDQDETIGPNKPFADIAYGLASQNIAVSALREANQAVRRRLQSPTLRSP